ncbi:MAG: ribonuclease P protein component [Bacteroidota bacterium]
MDESFGKSERLCLKRRFEALLADGSSFFIYPFRVIYLEKILGDSDKPVQIAITVKKRQFKRAVKRNLIRRRTKESWRRRKQELYDYLRAQNNNLIILLVYGADEVLPYAEIDRKIGLIIERLKQEIVKAG